MITEEQKNEILDLVEEEKERLGSYRAVANKCRISEATISQLRKGTYGAGGNDIYHTIALALGYSLETENWVIANNTTNFRIIEEVLDDAKNESMFMGISHCAGSGKTATSKSYLVNRRRQGAFMVRCKEWSGRPFLKAIAHEIGADLPKGYVSVNDMIESIADTFNRMAYLKPELIVDQANSLKSSAIRTIIHLFNECEDTLGLVILGTDALEHEIKRGVRLNITGYDEFDSRFGRKYIHLIGNTLSDARKICEANGITNKELQNKIFHECEPTRKEVESEERTISILVVEDTRRLKRLIKRYRLLNKRA